MKAMDLHLKFEEISLMIMFVYLYSMQLDYSYWLIPALIFLPDVSMIGYVVNLRVGSYTYNFLHSRVLAIAVYLGGMMLGSEYVVLTGLILLMHISMDRTLGFGLKYPD